MPGPVVPFRRALWCAFALTVVVLGATSAPARAGIAAPPTPPAPRAPCHPARHRLCTHDDVTPAAARHALDAALDGNAVRRGLGLPSLSRLLGHGGTAAQRAAERKLLARGASARSTASAAAAQTVAGVKVSTDEEDDDDANPGVPETMSATEDLRRGANREHRSVKIAVQANLACPRSVDAKFNHGFARGVIRAEQRLLTVERAGRYDIATSVTLDIPRFRPDAAIDESTKLVDIHPYDERPDIYLTRTRRITDRRTGRTVSEAPVKLHGVIMDLWPEIWVEESGGFDDFIAGHHHNAADEVVPDRLMNEDAAWKAVRAFVQIIATRSRAAYAKVEPYWTTGNHCLTPTIDIPERMSPGETATVTARVTSTQGYATNTWGRWGYWWPQPVGEELLWDPGSFQNGDDNASDTWKITAPSSDWPDSKPIVVHFVWFSKIGKAEITKEIREAPTELHAKVTAVSGSLAYDAHYPANRYAGDDCAVAGSEQYALSTSAAGSGQPTDGTINSSLGLVMAPYHLHGTADWSSSPCALGHGSDTTCHTDLDDDGMLLVSFSHADGAPTANVQITAFGRDINDYFCHDEFKDDWVHGDDQYLSTTVPWSAVTGTSPYTVSGSDHVDDGQRSVSRTVSVTLQPTDADGHALG